MGDVVGFTAFIKLRRNHLCGIGNRIWETWREGPEECAIEAAILYEIDPVRDADWQWEARGLEKRIVALRSSRPGGIAAADPNQAAQAQEELLRALQRLAEIRRQQHRWVEGASPLMQLARLAESADQKAIHYVGAGTCLERAQKYKEAIRVYELGLRAHPESKDVRFFLHNNVGFCCVQLGRFSEAGQRSREAAQIAPERHNGHKNLALSCVGLGRYVEAIAEFLRAIELGPRDPRARDHLLKLLSTKPNLYEEVPGLRERVASLYEQNPRLPSCVRYLLRTEPPGASSEE